MAETAIVFDHVWKRFHRGERHDSLRDLIPATIRRLRGRERDVERQGDFWALRDVSFEVKRGEALGIIGPNGAGKSTTLKLLTRILKPTKGSCSVIGRIGALIEVASGFHQDLTGRENVFLQGAIMGMKRAEIASKLDAIIDFAGVAQFIDTPVKRYSSGMNARLGFSIAAHLDPEVLIIDEVLSVGDMSFQERCLRRMTEFKESGAALVFVSHNLQAASALCDRLLFLKHSIRSIGEPTAVLRDYLVSQSVSQADAEGEVRLYGATLSTWNGDAAGTVAPGERLRFQTHCRFAAPLADLTFGFVVSRSTDRLVVYDANFTSEELRLAPQREGDDIILTLDFVANLARGQYDISFHAFHNPTQCRLAESPSVAVFGVDESRTWSGMAHLDAKAHASHTAAVALTVAPR